MTYRRGMKSMKSSAQASDWLTVSPGESRRIRFGERVDEVLVRRKHFLKGKKYTGSVRCLADQGQPCLLCKNASKDWGAPVSIAADYFLTVVIDREDNRAKYYEGGNAIKAELLGFMQANDMDITQVDFALSRQSKTGTGMWQLTPIPSTQRALSEEEKAMLAKLDFQLALASGEKTADEIKALLDEAPQANEVKATLDEVPWE